MRTFIAQFKYIGAIVVLPCLFGASVKAVNNIADLPVLSTPRIKALSFQKQNDQLFRIELVEADNYGNGKNIEHIRKAYDLSKDEGRLLLLNDIDSLLSLYDYQKGELKTSQNTENFPISGDIKRALKFLKKQVAQLHLNLSKDIKINDEINLELAARITEVSESINYNYRYTVLPKIQLANFYSILRGEFSSRLGKSPLEESIELKQEIPKDSTYWAQPKDMETKNLTVGFDRKKILDYTKIVFEYKKPKTGYGTHAGFRATFNNDEYKIRIGDEARVAPFASRVIWALGYNTLPMDYAAELHVKYSRKYITEYNLRKQFKTKVKFTFLKLFERNNQRYHDPFKNIVSAKLKDGSVISGYDLKTKLLFSTEKKAEMNINNFNVAYEDQIEELRIGPVSVEKLKPSFSSIGPWNWSADQHIERKELRGYGLIAAWLGQYDARTENTRLYLIENEDGTEVLRHYISDVGSGLGGASGILNFRKDRLDKFKDHFLNENPNHQDEIISSNYKTISRNKCFESMTKADARWIFTYIDRLSEKQLKEALSVSGFSKDEVELAYNKLMLRKENIRTLLFEK